MSTETAARMAKKKRTQRKPSKKLPVCTKRDLRTPKRKRRKCTPPKSKAVPQRPSPAGAVAAPPVAAPTPSAFPTPFPTAAPAPNPSPAPSPSPVAGPTPVRSVEPDAVATAPHVGLAVYSGPFQEAQAQRLLFRAGFGPRPGQAAALAGLGVREAVSRLLNPGATALEGPAPTGGYLVGGQFAPYDKWGHIHLEMLDRMVRSTDSLTERMTLVLHDWFGVSRAAVEAKLTIEHIALLRANWRGSFRTLLKQVTVDPGMLVFLGGSGSSKWAPNENYARELMELYALGADRGAYSETDVRQLARAFTGWRHDWSEALRYYNFRLDPNRFDTGTKTVFAGTAAERRGNLNAESAVDAVVDHPMHPSFVVRKMWSYFIPTEPAAETQQALEALYRASGERLDRLVEAILLHPDLYQGAAMTKPPVVYVAGLMRGVGAGITTDAWIWRCELAGQHLGMPPSVAGWNDRAWMNTSSFSARWGMAHELIKPKTAAAAAYTGKTETADQALTAALSAWGNPVVSADHLAMLTRIASRTWIGRTAGDNYGSQASFLANRQNVLLQLVGSAPDAHVC
ncbi:MAG: DUF1800 family protein [Solirubrobacteraceae bacterium]|nr:DUF1800 family protein [Solirubrobacteraceae bacterium]